MADVDESIKEAFRSMFAEQSQPMVDSLQYGRILEHRDFYKKVLRECPGVVMHGLVAADHVFWMAKWIHDDFSISVDKLVRLHRKWSVGTWESIIRDMG